MLCFLNIIGWNHFYALLESGFLFKFICAILDTPFCYLGVYVLKKISRRKYLESYDKTPSQEEEEEGVAYFKNDVSNKIQLIERYEKCLLIQK
jgi:hypothetical protein